MSIDPKIQQMRKMRDHSSVAALHAKVVIKLPWLTKKCKYTLAKKILYTKLIYCDYPNKNFEHPDLKITKIWVQQK